MEIQLKKEDPQSADVIKDTPTIAFSMFINVVCTVIPQLLNATAIYSNRTNILIYISGV